LVLRGKIVVGDEGIEIFEGGDLGEALVKFGLVEGELVEQLGPVVGKQRYPGEKGGEKEAGDQMHIGQTEAIPKSII